MKMVCAPTAQKRGLCGLLSDDDVKGVFFSFSFLFLFFSVQRSILWMFGIAGPG